MFNVFSCVFMHFNKSDKSEEILSSYSSSSTVKLYLTATYNKSLKKWNVPQECQIFWDMEDERLCKSCDVNGLINKHGNIVNIILTEMIKEGSTIENIMDEYKKYPDLHILTTMFDPERWDTIKDSIMDSKYGFSMDTLFALTKGKNKEFQYKLEVKQVLQFISGSRRDINFKNKDLSMFTRINNLISENTSRHPFTQLWFLPVNGINDISVNLKKMISEDEILNKYDVYIVNSKSNDNINDVRSEIEKREIEAKENMKNGLIILAGNMLTLGITLPLCDIVFLMNDTLSSDKVMQMMYRSMTESKKKDKKCGFVIDMKISRVLHACISYNIHKKMHNTEEKIRFLIENHLINIDSDYLINNKINSDKIITKLMEIWKSDPINNINTLLKQIEDDVIDMNNIDQAKLNEHFIKSIKGNKFNIGVELKNDENVLQNIKNGKEIINNNNDTNSDTNNDTNTDDDNDNNSDDEPENVNKKISFTKDVLPFIIPLTCLLTRKNTNNDFIEMLNLISNDIELLEIFNDQTYIWWNNNDIINIVKSMITKYIEKNSNTYNITIMIKMTLTSLIDKHEELLEFISDRLKPKQKEKKEFGEVYTPIPLVNDMLEILDECYKKENNGVSIFTVNNLKWGDIVGSGMGNFSIRVFSKLMDGLKNSIKDDKKRKKHILENMLYMCEMNKKNVFISKQIFDINGEYNLNIHCGDGLTLDLKEIWKIDKFDVIIGNPPYQEQKEGNKKTQPLWQKFVLRSFENLKKDGYLVLVHPCGWRSPEGIFRNVYEKIMEKKLMYLSVNDFKKGREVFGVGTNFDYYCIKNSPHDNTITKIKDIDGEYHDINFKQYKFIPNGKFELFNKLIAQNDEETVKILYSRSDYASDKKWTNLKKTKEYIYPCCYSITMKNGINFYYSSTNNNGHFNVPKVIWSNGLGTYPVVDEDGKYGLTQFSYGIIDSQDKLKSIEYAMNSKLFLELFTYCKFTNNKYDYKVISTFKKDFYVGFLPKLDNKIQNIDSELKLKSELKPELKSNMDVAIVPKILCPKLHDKNSDNKCTEKIIPKKIIPKKIYHNNSDSDSDSDSEKIVRPIIKKIINKK